MNHQLKGESTRKRKKIDQAESEKAMNKNGENGYVSRRNVNTYLSGLCKHFYVYVYVC